MKFFLLISLHLPLVLGQSKFTSKEQKGILDLHNLYRSNVTPPASDMNFLEWNYAIATSAQQWADTCNRFHSSTKNGENMYFGNDESGLGAIRAFHSEYSLYNYWTQACSGVCGHYTQVVWAKTAFVGCGYKECSSSIHIVCQYFPAGNLIGAWPYETGQPCSHCTKSGFCHENLCVTKTICQRNPEVKCECKLQCYNCGKLDGFSCTCDCADGWRSLNCLHVCVDKDPLCPVYVFQSPCAYDESALCPGRCKSCNLALPNSTNLCCGGKVCPNSFLIEKTCECGKLDYVHFDKASIAGLFYSLLCVSLTVQVLF